MTYYDSFNTLHIKDTIIEKNIGNLKLIERNKRASVFIQVMPYTFDFIYGKCLEAVNTVISLQE
jgi:hypothetical protein